MKRVKLYLTALLPLLFVLPAASPAAAQLFYEGADPSDVARARHKAFALNQFQEVLGTLVDAANHGDSEQAAELYADDAFILLGEEVGIGDPGDAVAQWFAGLQGMRASIMHFDASGNLAYATLRVVQNAPGNEAKDGEGTMVMVLRRSGLRDWVIQSQTLVMH